MSEQIIITVDRPNVGVAYKAVTMEPEYRDRLAAAELSLQALAQHVRDLREMLGIPCPPVVLDLAVSDLWQGAM